MTTQMTNRQETVTCLREAATAWMRTMTVDAAVAKEYVDPDVGLTNRAREFLARYLAVCPDGRRFSPTADEVEAAIGQAQDKLMKLGESLFRRSR